jgi:hypothetical protein
MESTDDNPDRMPAVSIAPGVSILGVLSNLNYAPWYALAEYVDNALQSADANSRILNDSEPAYKLRVDISYDDRDGGTISILDNAAGIARRDFDRAFRAAETPPDRTGLSEFGMGMKSASIWFARNWTVSTTSVGDPHVYSIDFDMQAVLANNLEQLTVSTAAAVETEHFTRIELRNLNQFLRGRTLGKVRDHLREIYRDFLRSGALDLSVAGQQMSFSEPELLKAADYRLPEQTRTDDFIEWRKQIHFVVQQRLVVDGWAGLRAEGKTNGTGFSLFRRGRVILGTGDTPYRPARIFGQGNSYRSQRLIGEFQIEGLSVSHTKDGFQWQGLEDEFHEELRAALDADPIPLLRQAENYRAREATRVELKRIRQATENTVEAAKAAIPSALNGFDNRPGRTVREAQEGPIVEDEDESSVAEHPKISDDASATGTLDVTKSFAFSHESQIWNVTVTSGSRPGENAWLLRHVDIVSGTGSVDAKLVLNTAHPFLRQFSLGSSDALESVLRIAVALVVSEVVQTNTGDGENAAQFMRHVNILLGAELSKRHRSGI